jgi:hypothetical protein
VTIRKGEAWGAPCPLPSGGVLVHDDDEARRAVTEARRAGRPVPALGLLGGDLCRALGGTGDEDRLRSADAMTFPVDLGVAWLDGEAQHFLVHVVARRALWLGRVVVVMNGPWLGEWNLGPRAHPNDGLLDASDARLRVGELLAARSRLKLGTHLPHPRIATRRAAEMEFDFDRPMPVRLDGREVGTCTHLRVALETDALTVVV